MSVATKRALIRQSHSLDKTFVWRGGKWTEIVGLKRRETAFWEPTEDHGNYKVSTEENSWKLVEISLFENCRKTKIKSKRSLTEKWFWRVVLERNQNAFLKRSGWKPTFKWRKKKISKILKWSLTWNWNREFETRIEGWRVGVQKEKSNFSKFSKREGSGHRLGCT